MGRKAIGPEAKTIIYKVYMYFAVEAEKFKSKDGYFQKVQSRVSKATGVSINFISKMLRDQEIKLVSENVVNKTVVERKRKLETDDINLSDGESNMKIAKTGDVTVTEKQTKNVLLKSTKALKSVHILQNIQIQPLLLQHTSVLDKKDLQKLKSATKKPQETSEPTPLLKKLPSQQKNISQKRKNKKTKSTKTKISRESNPAPLLIELLHKKHEVMNTGNQGFTGKDKVPKVYSPNLIKPIIQSPSSVPELIKIKPIELEQLLSNTQATQRKKSSAALVKLFPIPRNTKPDQALQSAYSNKSVHIQSGSDIFKIETKTVPIEFDPGSFIKSK